MENKNLRMILYWIYLTATILCAIAATVIYFVAINPSNIHKNVSQNGTFAEATVQSFETDTRVVNGIRYFPIIIHFEMDGKIYEGKTNYAYTREDAEAIVAAGRLNIKYKKVNSDHAIIVGAEFKETPISNFAYPFTIGFCVVGVFGGIIFVIETVRRFRVSPGEKKSVYVEVKDNYFAETSGDKVNKNSKNQDEELKYKIITLPTSLVYVKSGKIKDLTALPNFILRSEEYFRKLNPGVDCLSPNYSYVLYGKRNEEGIDVQFTQAINKLGLESKTLKFKKLEGGKAATIMVNGSYNKLNSTCKKLLEVLKAKNMKLSGEVRFCYINGEWDTENPENYRTEIQIVLMN